MAKKQEPQAEPQELFDDELPEFVTIRWDADGDVELDLGGVNHYEAIGLLTACLRQLEKHDPPFVVRVDGEALSEFED